MSNRNTYGTTSRDFWIDHVDGKIFARRWQPSEPEIDEHPIVLFHDSLGCVDLWRNFPAALSASAKRPVIAYDRLGFGKSHVQIGKPNLDFIANEADRYFPAIRQQIGFNRFIAFGHSVGGAMAVHCAARYPENCAALITESAQFFPEDKTLQGIMVARDQFAAEGQIERLEKYHGEKARWVLGSWVETWLHPEFSTWSLAPVLPQVTCPLLAIHGMNDEYGSIRHPEMITMFSGGPSSVEIIPDTCHVPHRECEAIVLKLVTDFVASMI